MKEKNSISSEDWNNWRWQISNSYSGVDGLVDCLGPDGEKLRETVARYPFRVTPYYLSLADTSNPDDPVMRQCIPLIDEINEGVSVNADPFEEESSMPVDGLIYRYKNRAVAVVTSECPLYCRHCTRKNSVRNMSVGSSRDSYKPMLEYVSSNTDIREIIISGGEPLLLDIDILDWLLGQFTSIPHVEVIRIGTRVPVVLPMRIDGELCNMLSSHRPLWVNTQFNHPAELCEEAISACELLIKSGIPVSNQTVLLKGVNDSTETMVELCNSLQKHLIRPYYVFQCDPVRGTGHFHTDPQIGRDMSEALRNRLGGLSLPRFVADVKGSRGKVPL